MTSREAWSWDREQKSKKHFNIIGFEGDSTDESEHFHCVLHKYARLIERKNERGVFICPDCGIKYTRKELMRNVVLKSRKSKYRKSMITSKHTKKKLSDQTGNPINPEDKDIMLDIARGNTVKSYHEYIK